MPAGEDPAEIATAEGGGERFRELVAGAVDLPEFQIGLILTSVDSSSPQDRDRGLSEAAPVLVAIPPGATREELTRRVAESLDIDPAVVVARLAQTAPAPTPVPSSGGVAGAGASQGRAGSVGGSESAAPGSGTGAAAPGGAATGGGSLLSRRERRERSLLAMCIARPQEGREYIARLEPEHLTSPLTVRAVAWLKDHLENPTEGLDQTDRELHSLIAAMVVRADPAQVGEGSIRRNFMELELAALEDQMTAAAERGDAELRARLNRERSALVEEVRKAEG
jgi:DNA primase